MRWETPVAILISALLIAASIAITNRYQISAAGYGYGFAGAEGSSDTTASDETVFRLDRWTGRIDECTPDLQHLKDTGEMTERCPTNYKHNQ